MSETKEHPGRWPVKRAEVATISSLPCCDPAEVKHARDYILQLEAERDEALSNYGEQSDLLRSYCKENKQLKARVAELEKALVLVEQLREARREYDEAAPYMGDEIPNVYDGEIRGLWERRRDLRDKLELGE